MQWYQQTQEQLAAATVWNYLPGGPSYAEPAAFTALSLIGGGNAEAATAAAQWLGSIQGADGSIGISATERTPQWPTALAISAWTRWQRATNDQRFATNIELAVGWTLSNQGKTMPRQEGLGHDTTLRGWSWAANTHSWLEPTAMFVAALIHAGKRTHPRTGEAIRLLIDRQLPQGGFNYGNTVALGQRLLSQVQPTGLALATLSLAAMDASRVQHSLDYLSKSCKSVSSTVSLCFAAIGLASYGRRLGYLDAKLTRCFERVDQDQPIYKLALLSLAAEPTILFRNK